VFVVFCVGSGLCDGLITSSEESYWLCVCVCMCLIVCDIETSTTEPPRPNMRGSVEINKRDQALRICFSVGKFQN